jgi:hypothetical protein
VSIDDAIRKEADKAKTSTIMQLGNIAGTLSMTLKYHDRGRFSLGTTDFNGESVSVVIRSTDCPDRTRLTLDQIQKQPLNKPISFDVKAAKPLEEGLGGTAHSQVTESGSKGKGKRRS